MTGPAYPSEDEIHAYVDDALDPARRDELAAVLRGDDALAARVDAYRADRDELRRALRPVFERPLPAAWQARIAAATAPRRFVTRRGALASSLAVAAATAAVLVVSGRSSGDRILDTALVVRGTVSDGDLSEEPSGNNRDASLSSGLGLKVRAPNLQRFGFRLVGMRVMDAGGPSRAAQLAYRDAHDRRLTIYVRPSDGIVRFDLLRRGDDRVCIWQDDVVSAVIVAPMSAGEMMRVASSAYAALNL